MKHIPNILSFSRIILSIALFFFLHNPAVFMVLYILSGLSDILDGFLARKWNVATKLGARLDSLGDLILCAVILVTIFKWMGEGITVYVPLILCIAVIRFINIIIAAYKYHTFAIIHTIGNKLTGLLLFFIPFGWLTNKAIILWIIGMIALTAALEESIIHLTSKELDLDRKSIFLH